MNEEKMIWQPGVCKMVTAEAQHARVHDRAELCIVDVEFDADTPPRTAIAALRRLRRTVAREIIRLIRLDDCRCDYVARRVPEGVTAYTVSRLDSAPHAYGLSFSANVHGLMRLRKDWAALVAILRSVI